MRVVHAPSEIAGQMGILCQGLRNHGINAHGYNWFNSYLRYNSKVQNIDAFELIRMVDALVKHADLFHFHNGNSLFTGNTDVPMLASAGKRMIMHHWGSDVRTVNLSSRLNRYRLPPSYMSDEQIHQRLKLLSKHIHDAIVQDYELYPHVADYYKRVHVLPLACRTGDFAPVYPPVKPERIRIVHAPTNRKFKGTAYVEAVVRKLSGKYPVELVLVENKSHEEAVKLYRKADLIIDQIFCGTYGMFAVEAMALGKPVLCYVRPDVAAKKPSLPIINANRDTLAAVLRDILRAPERLHEIGKASRSFAERYHDTKVVIPKLIRIYQKALGVSG